MAFVCLPRGHKCRLVRGGPKTCSIVSGDLSQRRHEDERALGDHEDHYDGHVVTRMGMMIDLMAARDKLAIFE